MFNLNNGLWYYLANDLGVISEIWQYVLLTAGFVVISMVAGYFLGSINSAIIISKILYHDDIRKHGSGNAGMTNMLRTYGLGAGVLTIVGDLMKTVIAILIGAVLGGFGYLGGISVGGMTCDFPLPYIAGFFAVIGHVYPIYYGFKGGKGVLCTATLALVLTPVEFALLLVLFILIVYFSKYISLGSVSVAVLYPVAVHGHLTMIGLPENGIVALITILLAIFIVYCHRENLKRISEGTERKFSIGGKKKSGDGTK